MKRSSMIRALFAVSVMATVAGGACSCERERVAQRESAVPEPPAPTSGRAPPPIAEMKGPTSASSDAQATPSTSAPVAAPPAPARELRKPPAGLADLKWSGEQRLAHAKQAKLAEVTALFDKAGVKYPPHDVLYRVFKQENEFEVWAGNKKEPLKLIATWGICAASGDVGPKRAEGDRQVPEGYYKVGYFHPMSAYYLSAQVNYPNASDRVRGGKDPGGDILIHGRCASIGCVSMTDERIEEIYLIGWGAFMAGRPTNIHIFPGRDMKALLADPKRSEHHAFWREIEPGLTAFDRTHRIPNVTIERDGRYVVAAVEE